MLTGRLEETLSKILFEISDLLKRLRHLVQCRRAKGSVRNVNGRFLLLLL